MFVENHEIKRLPILSETVNGGLYGAILHVIAEACNPIYSLKYMNSSVAVHRLHPIQNEFSTATSNASGFEVSLSLTSA